MLVTFELDGVEVQALNGGPLFTFSEAISLVVTVDTQDEIDRLWDTLTGDGGEPARFARAMGAVLSMTKLDIAEIEKAAGV